MATRHGCVARLVSGHAAELGRYRAWLADRSEVWHEEQFSRAVAERAFLPFLIATPVAWKELRKGFDPSTFTIRSAGPLLKRADPWKDLAASAISLETARKKRAAL